MMVWTNVQMTVGKANEAGIDCDAGQKPGGIPQWNAFRLGKFLASGSGLQWAGSNAMRKPVRFRSILHSVVDEGAVREPCPMDLLWRCQRKTRGSIVAPRMKAR